MAKRLFFLVVVLICVVCGPVLAETEILPAGAKVSATTAGDIVTVTITGVTPEDVEFYSYKKVVHLGPVTTFKIEINQGYRFNFKFGGGFYALLTPEMATRPPKFFGPGIGMDCKNQAGCCFMIQP
jgi:hypothetical protein